MKFKIPDGTRHILQNAERRGLRGLSVGGCVRDLLRGVEPHDWDICTSVLPEETEQCFADRRIIKTGLKHGTVTVMEGGGPCGLPPYLTVRLRRKPLKPFGKTGPCWIGERQSG